jgi:hypothetical protein
MTASSPHASSWPPAREEDDGLDLLGTGPRAVHRVSRAPLPSSAPVEAHGPSIVISPHAEVPTAAPRRKRPAEPTLVIRDKQQVDELRAGVRRIARAKARQRWKTLLIWGGAGSLALAFGFGTAVAFFAARSGGESRDPVKDSPFAAPVVVKGENPDALRAPAREAKLAVPAAPLPAAPEPVPAAARPAASKSEPSVVSLSDLPEAPEKEAKPAPAPARAPRTPASKSAEAARSPAAPSTQVISLEDL